jgi:hypothetical protein
MTTIASGKLYLTTGTLSGGPPYTTITGGTTIPLDLMDWEENINKALVDIQIPVPRGSWTTKDAETWLIDLKRIKRLYKFVTRIKNDSDGTMLTKLGNLRKLIGVGAAASAGTVTVIWGTTVYDQQTFDANFQKVLIKKGSSGPMPVDSSPKDIAMPITLSMIVGTNR